MEEPKTVSVKPGDWVLFRGSGYDPVGVHMLQAEKQTPSLVKFVGRGYPRQCNVLSVVAAFADKATAERVRDGIGGIAGEYNRRRRAAEDERSRRVTEALTAANQQIRTLVASEAPMVDSPTPPKPAEDRARENLAGYIEQLGTPDTIEEAIAQRDMWVESAAQFSRNEDYYRGLLDQIAAHIGPEAWKADDGNVIDDEPVRARLPDLVAALTASPAVAEAVEWAVSRWKAEVENRPMQNIHRRSLDDAWRQVVRHFGGDDAALLGPSHDSLKGDR